MIGVSASNSTVIQQPFFVKSTNSLQNYIEGLLSIADVRLQGSRPWDIRVHSDQLWQRIAAQGSIGLGEAYVDGLWDCEALDQFFDHILLARLPSCMKTSEIAMLSLIRAKISNPQSKQNSLAVADLHYNLGNEFYEAMLDPYMQYTCGYFTNLGMSLEEAQEAKLHLICKKLDLKPGERVLELGSGWGGFACFAAKHYGVHVAAYNISVEQVAWARERSQGLPIQYYLQDYREATGEFDKVVSIGMCEHVGPKNYRNFFKLVHERLRPGGLFLLHTIGNDKSVNSNDPWMCKYIFPGSVIPSPSHLGQAMDDLFVMEDWHNFGVDYDHTLMAWNERFENAWPRFQNQYGERFYRMWRYYLLSCAGGFRSRYTQLFQIVLSKGGLRGGWRTER